MADDELDLDSEDAQVLDPNIRKELREGRKERAKQVTELAQAKREIAFVRAGIDDTTPLGRMFVKSYEGDATIEAIRAAAEEIPGLVKPPEPDPNAMSAQERDVHQQMAGASGGDGIGGPDLRTQFHAELAEVYRKGGSVDDLMAVIDTADPSLGVVRKGVQ